MRTLHFWLALGMVLMLSACGGGNDPSASASASAPVPVLDSNAVRLVVDGGPDGTAVNVPYVSVTLCLPGTKVCETVDHIVVDTGSSGLRVLASALKNSGDFAAAVHTPGSVIAECLPFASGFTWGSLTRADIKLGEKVAGNAAMQLIGSAGLPAAPMTCAKGQTDAGTIAVLHANGIIGVGSDVTDCGLPCAQEGGPPLYYACGLDKCRAIPVAVANQIHNPIALFDKDNNGSLIRLPAVAEGMSKVEGQLVFGIGTRSNNALGPAHIFPLNEFRLISNAVIDGNPTFVAFDSGSTGTYFSTVRPFDICPAASATSDRYYCGAPATVTAQVPSLGGVVALSVAVTDETRYRATWPGSAVMPGLSGPTGTPNTPDEALAILGMPAFYGRTMFIAHNGAQVGAVKGPFVAFY